MSYRDLISSKNFSLCTYSCYYYNSQVSWCRHLYSLLHTTNALCNKGSGYTMQIRCSFCIITVNGSYCTSLQTGISSITTGQTLSSYMQNFVKCHSCWVFRMFGSWISKSRKFLLKLRVHHRSRKFALREINSLYSKWTIEINLSIKAAT